MKTEKSREMTNIARLNYQRGLTSQNLNAPYLVLYNASAKNANATVVKRSEIDLEFIVESKTYVFYSRSAPEAFYLAAILNAATPNLKMKDFQTKGLFGARDVHKKILDIFYPKYDSKIEDHQRLSQLSKLCHARVKAYLKKNPRVAELTAVRLGKLRSDITKHLSLELSDIDKIVRKIID